MNIDDLDELLDSIDKMEPHKMTEPLKSKKPLKEDEKTDNLMDELLKETLYNTSNEKKSPSPERKRELPPFKMSKEKEKEREEPIKQNFINASYNVLDSVIKNFDNNPVKTSISPNNPERKFNEFEGLSLDPDDLLKEFEENELKEKKIKDRFEHVFIKSKNAPQNPLIVLKKDKKYSSHEMVEEQLNYFQKIKSEKFSKLLTSNIFRAKAVSDFDPSMIYTQEESKTMLKFSKNSTLVVMAAFTSEWLLGYVHSEKDNETEVKIFPLMMVIPFFNNLPMVKRGYEIKFWSMFGNYDIKEDKDLIYKSVVDHLFIDSPTKPKAIYQAIKDFNYFNPEPFLYDDIPLLSLRKGDLIAVTKLPNAASWAEGFIFNKDILKIGLFHVGFTTLIKFKIEEN